MEEVCAMPRNQEILANIQELELIEEHKILQEKGEPVSLSV